MVLNHDFKLNTPLKQSYPKVKKRYNRRIERLLNILAKEKNVLIVYMEIQRSTISPKNDAEIIQALEKLNKTFTANISLLYFKHDENKHDGEYSYQELDSNVTKITRYNRDRSSEEHWSGNAKNVKLILQSIGLK